MSESLTGEAIRKTLTVRCDAEEAFRVFTEDARSWWPVDSHAIHDEVAAIVFEQHVGGAVYELSASGEKGHWATILAYESPTRLVLSWEVNPRNEATEVEVRFTQDGDQTTVELEHRGWERITEDAADKRAHYDSGWDFVLGRLVERTG